MRLIRKLLVLGLAAFGAYRLYELGRARATQVSAQAGPPVGDALDTVKVTAAKVRDDLGAARDDVVDDLKTAVGADDSTASPEPRMAVSADLDPAADPRERHAEPTSPTPHQ
jgi:hypothetical protein